jgi:hypothetical protein
MHINWHFNGHALVAMLALSFWWWFSVWVGQKYDLRTRQGETSARHRPWHRQGE